MGYTRTIEDDRTFCRALSEDVFARLVAGFRETCPGRTLRLGSNGHVHHVTTDGEIRSQWNTSARLDTLVMVAPVAKVLELSTFRATTSCWTKGQVIYTSLYPGDATPPADLFADVSLVGIPTLPYGVLWADHHLDAETGLCLRGVAVYECAADEVVMRWDLLLGQAAPERKDCD